MSKAPRLFSYAPSPLGPLLLSGTDDALSGVSFPTGHKAYAPKPEWRPATTPFGEVIRQLDAYFAGDLRAFNLPLLIEGSAFQKTVWLLLAAIPYGATRSYGDLAHDLGKAGASRAVGLANGSNPLPIILPCHRVIGSSGALTGFGGGLPAKRFLLALEGHPLPPEQLRLI